MKKYSANFVEIFYNGFDIFDGSVAAIYRDSDFGI